MYKYKYFPSFVPLKHEEMLIKRISILALFLLLTFSPVLANESVTNVDEVTAIENTQPSDLKIADFARSGSPISKFGALTGVTLLISLVVFMARSNWHEKRQSR